VLLPHLLDHLITQGTLRLYGPNGETHIFSGPAPGPDVKMRLHDAALGRKLFLNPRLCLGEAYMTGTLTVDDGTIYDLLELVAMNMEVAPPSILRPLYNGFGRFFRFLQQYNPMPRARRNVAHHYDLSEELYSLFLDADRQYSCAYFLSPDDDLETAQLNKKQHLAAKLRIEPGQRVLDIGCGWGGLALYLARECGAEVVGLTLSEEQLKVARWRAAAGGFADRAQFHLRDYREEVGTYDRIVSVGMFEHVGVMHYPTYFAQVKKLLKPGGLAVLHSIGRSDGPGATNPWIRKYIFHGGYAPALSEVVPVVEKTGLWITDIEVLRLHYAQTLRAWRQRFLANRDRVKAIYDERFCRMWEFYLAGCEVAFRHMGHMVFQMQLAGHVDTVPLTRDYIVDWERGHRAEQPARAAADRTPADRAA
jgi:cyclopropane-fatty-acyl-phospholipid synthase